MTVGGDRTVLLGSSDHTAEAAVCLTLTDLSAVTLIFGPESYRIMATIPFSFQTKWDKTTKSLQLTSKH